MCAGAARESASRRTRRQTLQLITTRVCIQLITTTTYTFNPLCYSRDSPIALVRTSHITSKHRQTPLEESDPLPSRRLIVIHSRSPRTHSPAMSDEAANVPAAQKSGELPAALDPTVDEDSFHPHPPPPNSRRRLATRRSSWGMCGACGVMELEQGRKGLRTEGLEWSREGGDSPLSPAWGARRSSSERNGLAGSPGRRRDEHFAAGQEKGLTNFARVDAGWTSFLKSLASFSGDLSGLTAPPFIVRPHPSLIHFLY